MSQRIPPCRFCGRDLRRVKPRMLVSETGRGKRKHWGLCYDPECMRKFREETGRELERLGRGDSDAG